jgi:hypothetical protein
MILQCKNVKKILEYGEADMFDFEIQTEDYFTLGQFYHLSKITQFDNSSLLILELNRKRTLVWFIVGLATCWVNRVSHAFSPLSQRVSIILSNDNNIVLHPHRAGGRSGNPERQ